jgi:tetratricopeptide (TPR) repeat protein
LLVARTGSAAAPSDIEAASTDSADVDDSQEIDVSGFETTSHTKVEEAAEGSVTVQTEGFESTSVAEPAAAPAEEAGKAPELLEETSKSPVSESFGEMMIDLEGELSESTLKTTAAPVHQAQASPDAPTSPADSAPAGALSDVFEEFKEGMEEDGESGDYETYYNLGIAFKEMGLMEEAIGEFQKALKAVGGDVASEEYVKCCNMLGLCFVDRGLPQVAIRWFSRGLSSPGRNEETYQALRYDLACAHEMAGNAKAALEAFLDVYGVNINYRDVSEKIESLKNRIHG